MKRTLSFILALVMVLSMVPAMTLFHAHAEETTETPVEVTTDYFYVIAGGGAGHHYGFKVNSYDYNWNSGNGAPLFKKVPVIKVAYDAEAGVTMTVTGSSGTAYTNADLTTMATVIADGKLVKVVDGEETTVAENGNTSPVQIPGTKNLPEGTRYIYFDVKASWNTIAADEAAVAAAAEAVEALLAAMKTAGAVIDGIIIGGNDSGTLAWQYLNNDTVEQMNAAFTAPVQAAFPNAQVAMFGGVASEPWTAIPGNTAFWNMGGMSIYSNGQYFSLAKPDGFAGASYVGSPYNMLRWDVLKIKELLNNAENVIASTTSNYTIDRWIMNDEANTNYQRDAIIHAVLSGAKIVVNESGPNYNEWKQSHAFMDLNRIAGFSDRKVIDVPYSWNNDFLLSGMYANGRNVWYITPNTDILGDATFMTETEDGLSFSINGQTVNFAGGRVIEGYSTLLGTWVETNADVMPVITYADGRYEALREVRFTGTDFKSIPTYYGSAFFSVSGTWGDGAAVTREMVFANQAMNLSGNANVIHNYLSALAVDKKDDFGIEVTVTLPETALPADSQVQILRPLNGSNVVHNNGIILCNGKLYYGSVADANEMALSEPLVAGGTYKFKVFYSGIEALDPRPVASAYVAKEDGTVIASKEGMTANVYYRSYFRKLGFAVENIGEAVVVVDNYYYYDLIDGTQTLTVYDTATGAATTNPVASAGYKFAWVNMISETSTIELIAKFYENGELVKTEPLQTVTMAGNADGVVSGVVYAPEGQTVTIGTCSGHVSGGAALCTDDDVCVNCGAVLREGVAHTFTDNAPCSCTKCSYAAHMISANATCVFCRLFVNNNITGSDTTALWQYGFDGVNPGVWYKNDAKTTNVANGVLTVNPGEIYISENTGSYFAGTNIFTKLAGTRAGVSVEFTLSADASAYTDVIVLRGYNSGRGSILEGITMHNGQFYWQVGSSAFAEANKMTQYADVVAGMTYTARIELDLRDAEARTISYYVYDSHNCLVAEKIGVAYADHRYGASYLSGTCSFGSGVIATCEASVVFDNYKLFAMESKNDFSVEFVDDNTNFDWANRTKEDKVVGIFADGQFVTNVFMDAYTAGTTPITATGELTFCVHTLNEDASCTVDSYCTICDAVVEEADGHNLTQVAGKAPTCTESGFADYEYCSDCDYTTYQFLPAAHTRGTDSTCTVCGKLLPNPYNNAFDTLKFGWATASSSSLKGYWSDSAYDYFADGTFNFITDVNTSFHAYTVQRIGFVNSDPNSVRHFALSAEFTLPEGGLPTDAVLAMLTAHSSGGYVEGGILLKNGQFYWGSADRESRAMTQYAEVVPGVTYTVRREYDVRVEGAEVMNYYVYDAENNLVAEKVDVPVSALGWATKAYLDSYMYKFGFRLTMTDEVVLLDAPLQIGEFNCYVMSDDKVSTDLTTEESEVDENGNKTLTYTIDYTNRYWKDVVGTLTIKTYFEGELIGDPVFEEITLYGFNQATITGTVEVYEGETVEVEFCAHTIVVDAAVAPDCDTPGKTEGSHCSGCGMIVVPQEEIEALGHTPGDEVIENETEDGGYDKVVYCTVCDTQLSRETVAPCAHEWAETHTTDAEFGVAGKQHYACSKCGETKSEDISDPLTEATATPETIADLLAKAPAGATITLSAGTYAEIVIPAVTDLTIVGTEDAIVNLMTSTATINGLKLSGITFVEAGATTIALKTVANLTIVDCTFNGIGTALQSAINPGTVSGNVLISNNVIDNFGHNALQIGIAANANVEISNNTITRCGAANIEAFNIHTVKENATVSVTDNTFADCFDAHVVILLGNTEYNLVVDATATVTVTGNTHNGVEMTANDATVDGKRSVTATSAGTGHTAGDPVKENETAADCTNSGSYDEVVYCSVCGAEISRNTTTVEALGHTAGDPVKENETAADCTNSGSYDEVIYCSVCGEEISRNTTTVEATGHTAGTPVKENETASSYDEVIYCTVCNAEMSRETIETGPVMDNNYKLSAPGLSLGELIGFQCNVRADKINGGKYDRVYYVYNQYTYNANGELELVATVEGEYSSMVSGKYTYLISTCPVNAKLMSDIFEVIPYYELDGVTYRGVATSSSVKEQAMTRLNNASTTENIKAICVAMLNYGAAVQQKFSYSLDHLANADLSAEQKIVPTAAELNLTKTNTVPTSPFKPADGLSLGEVVYMQFNLKDSKYNLAGHTIRYSVNGGEEVTITDAEFQHASGYTIFSIPVLAKLVRQDHAISIYNASGDLVYSGMLYSVEGTASKYVKGDGSANEAVFLALMAYGDAVAVQYG